MRFPPSSEKAKDENEVKSMVFAGGSFSMSKPYMV